MFYSQNNYFLIRHLKLNMIIFKKKNILKKLDGFFTLNVNRKNGLIKKKIEGDKKL